MRFFLFLFSVLFALSEARAQGDFKFNTVTHRDMQMKSYAPDPSADAVVLDERGYAFMDLESGGNIYFEYYAKIKIFNKNGLDEGNFEVALPGNKKYRSKFEWVKASTYNYEGNTIKETKMDPKKLFKETHQYGDLGKFALPDVREGSVIEVNYKLSLPFIRIFRTWMFQSDIPKIHSEYSAKIPATHTYNISLRGPLKMSINESKAVEDCVIGGLGEKANCALMRFGMDNIPAFQAEEHMTTRKNFMSAIYFELNTVRWFDGSVKKFTEEWKDVDNLLIYDDDFGKQIKKANGLLPDSVLNVVKSADDLTKATHIYNFVRTYFTDNGERGIYTDKDVSQTLALRGGNCAEINLYLTGALQQAGLNAYPVILSTRDNGVIPDLYPVITGFNYVIAAVDLASGRVLLDGTAPNNPFGVLPMRCLNGRGRIIDSRQSGFVDLKPTQKNKESTTLQLALSEDGHLTGTIAVTRTGYSAIDERNRMSDTASPEENAKYFASQWGILSDYEVQNLTVLNKPLIEKANFEKDLGWSGGATEFFSPFLSPELSKNPFTASERSFPVDYGVPQEQTFIMIVTVPASLTIDDMPKGFGIALPNGGGRYTLSTNFLGDKLSVISNFSLTKEVYSAEEYHYLREFYARILQARESQVAFKKK